MKVVREREGGKKTISGGLCYERWTLSQQWQGQFSTGHFVCLLNHSRRWHQWPPCRHTLHHAKKRSGGSSVARCSIRSPHTVHIGDCHCRHSGLPHGMSCLRVMFVEVMDEMELLLGAVACIA